MKKVLAFFGAFNPPTIAHIELGRYAMEQTGRDGVLYVPSKSVYIEEDQGKSFAYADQDRLAMLRAVAEDNPWMKAIDRELLLESQPRTYDTLCYLRDQGFEPSLLMGSDKLPELEHGWKHVEEIVSEFGIVCMCRGKDDVLRMLREDPYLRSISCGITALQTPSELHQISSSEVRSILREIQQAVSSLQQLVPSEVADVIFQRHFTADAV